MKWESYSNLHRALSSYVNTVAHLTNEVEEKVAADPFFEQRVCATVKMDGSNLGIHVVRAEGGEWAVEGLVGRNSMLWSRGEHNIAALKNIGKYGNAGRCSAWFSPTLQYSKQIVPLS